MSTIGKRLRNLRDQHHWTLKQVANKLGYSNHSTYSNWEYDRTEPDAEMLVKLGELFGVSVDYIVNGAESEKDFEHLDEKRKQMIEEIKTMSEEDVDYFHDFINRTKRK